MTQEIKKEGNQFYVGTDLTNALALISFFYEGDDTIIIDHTYVHHSLRGQGIGKALIDEVVKFAREEKLKVVPLCSFAHWIMKKTDKYGEYVDVLEP